MLELFFLIIVFFVAWYLIKKVNREATIEEARDKGMKSAMKYLKNPMLIQDYAEQKKRSVSEIRGLIDQGKIEAYGWEKYIFVESDPES